MNCITIQHCIVRQWAGEKGVSRYNYCIVIEAKGGVGHWAQAGCAWRARSAQAGVRGRSGAGGSGRAGVRSRRRQARGARGRQALGSPQAGAGRTGRARPGSSGWLRAVHSVHSTCF